MVKIMWTINESEVEQYRKMNEIYQNGIAAWDEHYKKVARDGILNDEWICNLRSKKG